MYIWSQIACCSEHAISVTRVAFLLFLDSFQLDQQAHLPHPTTNQPVLMTQNRETKLEREKRGRGRPLMDSILPGSQISYSSFIVF